MFQRTDTDIMMNLTLCYQGKYWYGMFQTVNC